MASNRYKELMKQAQSEKIRLTRAIRNEIKEIFKDVSKSLERKAVGAKRASLTERFMLDYKKAIDAELREVRKQLYARNKKIIEDAANAAVQSQLSFLEEIDTKYSLGLGETFRNAFSKVPKDAMNEILSGNMYKDRMGLSERIWADTKGMEKDIDYIIARGIAEKKSAYDLAKDLEVYLDPEAKKDWEWSNVYPNTRKQIDYNAQRMARTSINHAFFNANMKSYAKNPFVEGVEWMLSNSHYERQIKPFGPDVCDEYAKHDEGLGAGVFPVDKVPLPHPMCLCTQAAYIPKDFDEIGEELGRWVRGESNPTLDAWYGEFGREFAGFGEQDGDIYKFRKKESYSDWFDKRSDSYKKAVLGTHKYYLHKAGVFKDSYFDMPWSELNTEKNRIIVAREKTLAEGPKWKSGKLEQHVSTRRIRKHIPDNWTAQDYNDKILGIIDNKEADVYRYLDKYVVFSDGEWIVMMSQEGTMETAFPPEKFDNYVNKGKGYELLGKLKEMY